MVTVYDMTSGTLRQELEAAKKSTKPVQAAEMHLDTDYSPAPALQEVILDVPVTGKSVAHIAGLNIDGFISKMK
jgi:hypothetical protein